MRKMHRCRFISRMREVSSGHLLSVDIFHSVQRFCWRTVKVLIRLRECICPKTPFRNARPIYLYYSVQKSNIMMCTLKKRPSYHTRISNEPNSVHRSGWLSLLPHIFSSLILSAGNWDPDKTTQMHKWTGFSFPVHGTRTLFAQCGIVKW